MDIAKIILPHGGGASNTPELIVLHAMGQFIHVDQAVKDYYADKGVRLELNRDYHASEWLRAINVSAHQLIDPLGTRIKCREDNQRAWHARGFNTNSLGVESMVQGVHTYGSFIEAMKTNWLTDDQYKSGQQLVRYWMNTYNIQKDQVKYHYEISPGRKEDPGSGFPEEFRNEL